MITRPCELCVDQDDQLRVGEVCGVCNGSEVLDIKTCLCCAFEPSECGCDADWSDFVYEDDYVYWED